MKRLAIKLSAVIGGWTGWFAELPIWLRVMQWLVVIVIMVGVVRVIIGIFKKGR